MVSQTLQEHGTADMRAAGCECEWCEAWAQIDELNRQDERRRKVKRLLAMATQSDDPDGCWAWNHSLTGDGYARLNWHGWSQLAHRVAYELLVGPIPDELQIDHRCRNRSCINPRHLQPATSKQNNENRSQTSGSASGIRNVYWVARRNRWCVQVKHDRRTYWGGAFVDKADAIAAAQALRRRLFSNSLIDA